MNYTKPNEKNCAILQQKIKMPKMDIRNRIPCTKNNNTSYIVFIDPLIERSYKLKIYRRFLFVKSLLMLYNN